MHQYKRQIFLRDTDATGNLYFSSQLSFVMEALEVFFLEKGVKVQELIETGTFLLPVVHVEADFSAPLKVGDSVDIQLTVTLGNHSFTTHADIRKGGEEVGTVKLVQAAVSKESETSIPIPAQIAIHLRHLCID